MNKNKGFTLIELVVVIVILGIIGVVASLKTMELSSDARVAVMKSSRAAIQSAFDLFHAKQEMVNANIKAERKELLDFQGIFFRYLKIVISTIS